MFLTYLHTSFAVYVQIKSNVTCNSVAGCSLIVDFTYHAFTCSSQQLHKVYFIKHFLHKYIVIRQHKYIAINKCIGARKKCIGP